jgi:hypothetical protein
MAKHYQNEAGWKQTISTSYDLSAFASIVLMVKKGDYTTTSFSDLTIVSTDKTKCYRTTKYGDYDASGMYHAHVLGRTTDTSLYKQSDEFSFYVSKNYE